MIDWLRLTDVQRRSVIDEAEQLSGISAKAIEKDWWVTLTLKALFQSAYRQHMVFKGGTSLSKCWNMIARFSEDIDIALDPQAFEMEYREAPSKSYVEKLKKNGCEFTSTKLLAELGNQLKALGLPDNLVTILAADVPEDHPDTDPQTLYVRYPSLYDPNPYIADEVKVEVSVRSLRIPFVTVPIQSILYTFNPNPAYVEVPFPVEVVEAQKTFLEKIFLLHEEFGKPDRGRIKTKRMSRHLYDLLKMMDTPIGANALADHGLYNHLIQHREWYSRISWVDYNSLGYKTVSFLPIEEVFEDYRNDYETMREQMIYEDALPFDDLIAKLKILQGRIRLKYEHKTLDEIIVAAILRLEAWDKFEKNNGNSYETNVVYISDPFLPKSPANKNIIFTVGFKYLDNQLQFERITIQTPMQA